MNKNIKTFCAAQLQTRLAAYDGVNRYVIGYSGGLDSHVLLQAVAHLRDVIPQDLVALHINHGISPDALQWEAHCRQTCAELQIPLKIITIHANRQAASLENELREKRYQAFAEFLDDADMLLLGHHADDQAETVLLRMLRGSGSFGASGMPSARPLAHARLARPLLGFSRLQLASYAQQVGLSWVEDQSNQDPVFDRNYLRNQLLPMVQARWPAYQKVLTRFARINEQQSVAIDYFISQLLTEIVDDQEASLDLERLQAYPLEVQLSLLRGWLLQRALPIPDYGKLQQIVDQVIGAKGDANPRLGWSGAEVRRYSNRLHAFAPLPMHSQDAIYSWWLDEAVSRPGMGSLSACKTLGEGMRVPEANVPVSVRFRRGGERCKPAGRSGSRSLKKLLQEAGLPPWLRDRIPLVYQGDNLAAVGDLWVCEAYAAKEGEKSWLIRWQRPGVRILKKSD